MSDRPSATPFDIDQWLSMLDVEFVRLTECRIGQGWALAFEGFGQPGLHYVLSGHGQLRVGGAAPIELAPHRAIIVSPSRSYHFESVRGNEAPLSFRTISLPICSTEAGPTYQQCRAGEDAPELALICGHFRLRDEAAESVFAGMEKALVVSLSAADAIGDQLAATLVELHGGQPGASAMATALMEQILIKLFRKMLGTSDEWLMRLGLIRDPRIARAFAWLMTHPELSHSVASLAEIAAMSRSAFAAGFHADFGDGPMTVLRNVRLARAAAMLASRDISVEQVGRSVGYASRSSFTRAFRVAYGPDPTTFALARKRR